MEIKGKVIAVLDARGGISERTGSQWASQDFVVEYFTGNRDDRAKVLLTIKGVDRVAALCPTVGEAVTAEFDIYARPWTDREGKEHWTNELNCWKITRNNANTATQPEAPKADPNDPFAMI